MGPGQRPTFHFETVVGLRRGLRNKKEVKTASFSPPGVGGVLHDKHSSRPSRPALPGRSAGLTRDCFCNFVRRTHHQRACLSAVCSTAKRRCQR